MNGERIYQSGRRSGKNAAMMRYLAMSKPGTYAVVSPNGVRIIDNQGDAEVVEPLALPAPESEGQA